jgi:hypothetical protein
MNTAIVSIDGEQYLLYIKPEYKDGSLNCFSVLAHELVNPDCKNQTFMHEILSQGEKRKTA